MAIFDDIKLGLEQAIDYEKGLISAEKTTISILPLETPTSEEIWIEEDTIQSSLSESQGRD